MNIVCVHTGTHGRASSTLPLLHFSFHCVLGIFFFVPFLLRWLFEVPFFLLFYFANFISWTFLLQFSRIACIACRQTKKNYFLCSSTCSIGGYWIEVVNAALLSFARVHTVQCSHCSHKFHTNDTIVQHLVTWINKLLLSWAAYFPYRRNIFQK